MKVQKFIEVRLLKKRIIPVIDLVQYDTGVQLVFSVGDFDIPSGTSATLYVQKRSGKFVYQEKDISVSGNEITIDLENQALTEHGETKYQVKLKNGTDTVSTFTGVLRIEKSLADANAVESKTVIRAFDEAVADHVAEFQTKAEQIVMACIATIPDDYTAMEAKVNELANAVKGNLSGAVVFADDVSLVEHNPVVKVHGKNLCATNTLTVEGEHPWANKFVDGAISLKRGKYTISCDFSQSGEQTHICVSVRDAIETTTQLAVKTSDSASGKLSLTFEIMEDVRTVKIVFYSNLTESIKVTSCTFTNIQLEEGSVATDYEPYIDPSTVTVKRCGKNLLNPNGGSSSGKGLTFTNNGNGSFTVKGTATAAASFGLTILTKNPMYLQEGVTYTQSVIVLTGSMNGVAVVPSVEDGDGNVTWNYFSNNQTKTPEKHYKFRGYEVYVENGKTVDLTFKVQLEVGSIATEFEPFKEPTPYAPTNDGTVSGLTSVSPNMTILTDTEGAIVECEYNRDTNKVIEKLTNAIIALGGTV